MAAPRMPPRYEGEGLNNFLVYLILMKMEIYGYGRMRARGNSKVSCHAVMPASLTPHFVDFGFPDA